MKDIPGMSFAKDIPGMSFALNLFFVTSLCLGLLSVR